MLSHSKMSQWILLIVVCTSLLSVIVVYGMKKNSTSNDEQNDNKPAPGCGPEWGCYEGHCWSDCVGFDLKVIREWCYTTKAKHGDRKFVPCKSKADCDPCWKCADTCSVFPKGPKHKRET